MAICSWCLDGRYCPLALRLVALDMKERVDDGSMERGCTLTVTPTTVIRSPAVVCSEVTWFVQLEQNTFWIYSFDVNADNLTFFRQGNVYGIDTMHGIRSTLTFHLYYCVGYFLNGLFLGRISKPATFCHLYYNTRWLPVIVWFYRCHDVLFRKILWWQVSIIVCGLVREIVRDSFSIDYYFHQVNEERESDRSHDDVDLKHGEVDPLNKPHVGGGNFAGGTGCHFPVTCIMTLSK